MPLDFRTSDFTRFSLQWFYRDPIGILACSTKKSWLWVVTFWVSTSLNCTSPLGLILIFPDLLLLLSYCFFPSMVTCLDFYFPKQNYKIDVFETLLKTWDSNTTTTTNSNNNTANLILYIRYDCFPNALTKELHVFSK